MSIDDNRPEWNAPSRAQATRRRKTDRPYQYRNKSPAPVPAEPDDDRDIFGNRKPPPRLTDAEVRTRLKLLILRNPNADAEELLQRLPRGHGLELARAKLIAREFRHTMRMLAREGLLRKRGTWLGVDSAAE